jgi:8-oxo-dGTP pyrophosphatase MutT (NUDIX family)
MVREIAAGGLVIRRMKDEDDWMLAVIEPQRENNKGARTVLALPKGLVDAGEAPEKTAVREVFEETGLVASLIVKLADIKYVYVRSWGDKERVFKIVSFYLLRYESGSIGEIAPEMRIEVKQALWIPLKEAARKLAYRGEKDMVKRAQEYLSSHPED